MTTSIRSNAHLPIRSFLKTLIEIELLVLSVPISLYGHSRKYKKQRMPRRWRKKLGKRIDAHCL